MSGRPSVPPGPQEPRSGCRPQGQAPGWERACAGPAVDGGPGKDAAQPARTAHTRPEMGRVESLGVGGCGHPRPASDAAKEPSCRAHGFRSPRPGVCASGPAPDRTCACEACLLRASPGPRLSPARRPRLTVGRRRPGPRTLSSRARARACSCLRSHACSSVASCLLARACIPGSLGPCSVPRSRWARLLRGSQEDRERTGRGGKLPASSGRPGPSTVPGGAGLLTHHPLKSPGGRQGHVSRGGTGGTTKPAVSETRKK